MWFRKRELVQANQFNATIHNTTFKRLVVILRLVRRITLGSKSVFIQTFGREVIDYGLSTIL